jgi:hypothetical protein
MMFLAVVDEGLGDVRLLEWPSRQLMAVKMLARC